MGYETPTITVTCHESHHNSWQDVRDAAVIAGLTDAIRDLCAQPEWADVAPEVSGGRAYEELYR